VVVAKELADGAYLVSVVELKLLVIDFGKVFRLYPMISFSQLFIVIRHINECLLYEILAWLLNSL
jgi:hypothetical protein